MLVGSDRQLHLEEWNHTITSYPRDKSISSLFEEQVQRTPDATALVFGEAQLTYGELNLRANSFAQYLRGLGVGRDVLVAISMDRSLEMIVGLLAILKAGGAYVPLEPDAPSQRLYQILHDTRSPVLLTTEQRSAQFKGYSGHLLLMDGDSSATHSRHSGNLPSVNQAEDLAYVTYTSGSTGQPKGISIVHRGVVRLVKGTNYADFSPQQTFLLLAPLAFDASTFEIWGALLNGARLAIAPPEVPTLSELGDYVQRHQVTTMFLTTAFFHQVVEYQLQDMTGLRQLLTGGDVLGPDQVRRAVKELSNCRVIACYGPTEDTTFTTCYPLDRCDFGGRVPIGRPIANTQVYVLDENQQPVSIGVAGELCIGGDGLAREYWARPELTREKFVEVELSPRCFTRLYRSGDRVCWQPDGNLEFLDRLDRQVKIRGFRVEPGEIEHALRQHPGIADVTVQPRETSGGKRITAFVVLRFPRTDTAAEIREFLVPKLPSYMIPGEVVLLDKLPLTANGKVNRRALLEHHGDRIVVPSFAPPRNPIECQIVRIWQEVLDHERIGIHDSFLEMGGDSLTAMQIVSRICDEVHIEISIHQFLQHPTVARQAALIEEQQHTNPPYRQPSLQPSTHEDGVPLSYPQKRLWFLHKYAPDSQAYTIALAYRLSGPLDAELLERCLSQIVDRHSVLRTTFVSVGGVGRQRIGPRHDFKLIRRNLRSISVSEREQQLEQYLSADVRQPVDLEHGPLFRATILALNDEEHVLLFVVHHLVFDGWSEKVMFYELETLYTAGAADQPSPLSPLSFQYADFAFWQSTQHEPLRFETLRSYWRKQLQGAPALLELPSDFPRPLRPTPAGRTLVHNLPNSLCEAIRALSTQQEATLFITLLAAWKVLLFRYSAQSDLVVGTAAAHRPRLDLEPLIGFFANILVLRTNLSGNPTFIELMERVKQTTYSALSHQELPFDQVVQELDIERHPSYAPLAQIMFVLHSIPVALPGIQVRRVPIDTGTAKFDLTLFAYDQSGSLSLWFEYNSTLFSDEFIRRMAAHYQQIIEAVTSNPQLHIEQALPGVDATRRHPMRLDVHAPQVTTPTSATLSELVNRITSIWLTLLDIDHIHPEDDFFALGGHSLMAVELAAKLESEFGHRVSIAQIFQFPTILRQAQLLSSVAGAIDGPSLTTIRSGIKHPLVLLPNTGGRAFVSYPFLRNLPADIPLMVIDFERLCSTKVPRTIEGLAAECVKLLRSSSISQPYNLLGYSFGGMLAYELARQLSASGLQVGFVGIIDTGPAVTQNNSVSTKVVSFLSFAQNVPLWLADRIQSRQLWSTLKRHWKRRTKRLNQSAGNNCAQNNAAQAGFEVESKFSRQGYVDEKQRTRELYFQAFHSYMPGDYQGTVFLFRARIRPLFHHFTRDVGWSNVRVGQLEIRDVPGNHRSVMYEPNVQYLSRAIVAALG